MSATGCEQAPRPRHQALPCPHLSELDTMLEPTLPADPKQPWNLTEPVNQARKLTVLATRAGRSKFQDVELIDSGPFGKVLLLDGKVQSAEADERVYHECLVHPAMLHHPNPKTVFIMGGACGLTIAYPELRS